MLSTESRMLFDLHQDDMKAEEVLSQAVFFKEIILRDGAVDVGHYSKTDIKKLPDVLSENQDDYLFKCLSEYMQAKAKKSDLDSLMAIQKLDRYLASIVEDATSEWAKELEKKITHRGLRALEMEM